MVISHNILALNANRQLNITDKKKAKSIEKLSSGYRINRSADDAAGLAISEKMRRQIRGLTQASQNCQDGISLVQIADGALSEIDEMLHRGTELSVQAANGTLTSEDRNYIQKEINQIKEEINAISAKTTFNEIPVLQGGAVLPTGTVIADVQGTIPDFIKNVSPTLQAGHLTTTITENDTDYIAGMVDFSNVTSANIGQLNGTGFHVSCSTCPNCYSIQFTNQESSVTKSGSHFIYNVSTQGIDNGEDLLQRIISVADDGCPNDHFTSFKPGENPGQMIIYDNRPQLAEPENKDLSMARSTVAPGIAYTIVEGEISEFNLYIQAGTEEDQQIGLRLPTISTSTLELDYTSVSTPAGAKSAIKDFKNALKYVAEERTRMGAYQNRLEHTVNNLKNVIENTIDAESRIRDTDMATEMVNFSTQNIISQAGQSVLSQANQSNQGVLNLLNQ